MDKVKDEFRGFEAGFEGFPKHLPDDCVEYTLFVIDSQLNSQRDLRGRLEVIRKQSRALTDRLLKDYIWQRDSFNLQIECGNGTMHLRGLTNYGDSVEDEWLIVYLLRELSKQFQELWIKVVDTDGEFLLIEAANALPRWLNPEVANNRVWLHNGELYIIPLDTAVASTKQITSTSKSVNLEEAIDIIKASKTIIHSPLIEAEAFYRLRNYPSQITASLHHSPITIPRKLAHILHIRPQSIAPAIEAFYLRDPIALRKLQSVASELIFPPEDLVTISTRFTRVLYAQLKSQQFSAPAAWKNILVEPENAALSETIKAQKYARLETGMKVTSGFEMLLRDSKYDGNRLVRELKIIVDDLNAEDNTDLLTNEDINNWEGVTREDDEKWLDINFEDFEKELQGKGQENKSTQVPPTFGPPRPSGFGDANTEANLKKMVERFEAFLNDETAGAEGAELDDMDIDDDDDTTDDSEEEDKEVSFDEKEFAKMMREMMGLPSEESGENMDGQLLQAGKKLRKDRRENDINSEEESGEEREDAKIREVMERMKAELNEGGALDLELTPQKLSALIGKAHSNEANNSLISQNEDEADSDEEVDIDFNLAKNLLDSFKSQAGMAGPGGNLMGMMGFHLPRDEGDTTSTEDHP